MYQGKVRHDVNIIWHAGPDKNGAIPIISLFGANKFSQ
jgi:hypothetical protein